MQVSHAVAAATPIRRVARPDGRPTLVLHNSNDLTVRLLPCDVEARVAPATEQVTQLEIDPAQRLAGSLVAALAPRFGATRL